MNYIVFDLEATCDDKNKEMPREIIEVGAVKLRSNNSVLLGISEFNKFVKPRLNPVLTDFCKSLTKIRQDQINRAAGFVDVQKEFYDWITDSRTLPFYLISWGNFDKTVLIKECGRYRLPTKWLMTHVNLKQEFANIYGIKPCGVLEALRIVGDRFEGVQHRGIDDAINIVKIFRMHHREVITKSSVGRVA